MSEHGHTSANHELLWRSIGQVITALSLGDFTTKVSSEALAGAPEDSEPAQVAHRLNTMVDQLNVFAAEATRVSREIGTEGFFGCQMDVPGLNGTWKDLADNTNLMARNLTNQVRNIAQVTTAVAKGDLSRKVTVDADGEMLELKNTINLLVEKLTSFLAEVMRLANETGTQSKLGGNIIYKEASGVWKDVTDHLNYMSNTITVQVRSLSDTAQAVIGGDTTRHVTVEAQGEMKELRDTLNRLIEQVAQKSSS